MPGVGLQQEEDDGVSQSWETEGDGVVPLRGHRKWVGVLTIGGVARGGEHAGDVVRDAFVRRPQVGCGEGDERDERDHGVHEDEQEYDDDHLVYEAVPERPLPIPARHGRQGDPGGGGEHQDDDDDEADHDGGQEDAPLDAVGEVVPEPAVRDAVEGAAGGADAVAPADDAGGDEGVGPVEEVEEGLHLGEPLVVVAQQGDVPEDHEGLRGPPEAAAEGAEHDEPGGGLAPVVVVELPEALAHHAGVGVERVADPAEVEEPQRDADEDGQPRGPDAQLGEVDVDGERDVDADEGDPVQHREGDEHGVVAVVGHEGHGGDGARHRARHAPERVVGAVVGEGRGAGVAHVDDQGVLDARAAGRLCAGGVEIRGVKHAASQGVRAPTIKINATRLKKRGTCRFKFLKLKKYN